MNEDRDRPADDPDFVRAEAMVDDLAERMTSLASQVGSQVRRVVARAREEVEDMWAEAEQLSGVTGRN